MSKSAKEKLEELITKNKKVEETQLDPVELTNEVYVVTENPDKKSKEYLIVKIKYDIVSKKAIIEETKKLDQKVIGMRFPIEQENLKYYFNKGAK